jgi:hypothetical protein
MPFNRYLFQLFQGHNTSTLIRKEKLRSRLRSPWERSGLPKSAGRASVGPREDFVEAAHGTKAALVGDIDHFFVRGEQLALRVEEPVLKQIAKDAHSAMTAEKRHCVMGMETGGTDNIGYREQLGIAAGDHFRHGLDCSDLARDWPSLRWRKRKWSAQQETPEPRFHFQLRNLGPFLTGMAQILGPSTAKGRIVSYRFSVEKNLPGEKGREKSAREVPLHHPGKGNRKPIETGCVFHGDNLMGRSAPKNRQATRGDP